MTRHSLKSNLRATVRRGDAPTGGKGHLPAKSPVVPPFDIKWPGESQLQRVLRQHESNQQHQYESNNRHKSSLDRHKQILVFAFCAINIAAVTVLGWCIFEKIVTGWEFSVLEMVLVLVAIATLWWSGTNQQYDTNCSTLEDESELDEEDFING